ncbi:MAG TPA: hypothetical protein VE575_14315 [Acidimicrobiales bacterium]|nr:hypothetical protein [Acidimicrobiales bacterium]
MAYVAFASAKASPGVTTTVAALAATWPADRDLMVAELDPAGGDLAVRFDLAPEPGLVSLAAAGRRELDRSTFTQHSQPLPVAIPGGRGGAEGVATRRVLVGPVAADQAGAALSALRGRGLPEVMRGLAADVLVDCGRLDPSSAAHDIAVWADLLVVVARPVVAEVHHLASRLTALRPRALSLLLVGDRPYSVADVADAVGANPLGALPVDDRAAVALTLGGARAVRALRRSRLLRDARALAEGLADWLPPPSPPPRAGSSEPAAMRVPVAPPPTARSGPEGTPAPPPPPSPARARPSPNGQPPGRQRRRSAPPPTPPPAPPPSVPTPPSPAPARAPAPASDGPKHFRRTRGDRSRR